MPAGGKESNGGRPRCKKDAYHRRDSHAELQGAVTNVWMLRTWCNKAILANAVNGQLGVSVGYTLASLLVCLRRFAPRSPWSWKASYR